MPAFLDLQISRCTMVVYGVFEQVMFFIVANIYIYGLNWVK